MCTPKISVIIPCYNMERYVGECLDSVLAQTLSEIEVICVNDGSADGTLQILQQYRQKDSRITIIDQENQGVAAARNVAIRQATGEFIAFMDPDDFYPDAHTLELLYTKAAEHHALICGGSMSTFWQATKTVTTSYSGDLAKNTFEQEGFVDYRDYQFDFSFHRFLYNRAFLLENNLFFPLYKRSQDPPFLARAMVTAGSFYAVPDVVYRYRWGIQAASTSWPREKVRDMMMGRLDNLVLSAQHHLSQLHRLNVQRFESYVAKAAVIQALRSGDQEIFSLLKKLSEAIRPELLEEAGVQLDANGGYILHGYENWLTAASVEEGNAKMIPVVLAADENYVVPMSVTIASLLCNAAPETRYDIYILVPDEFSAISRMLLQKFEETYPGCKISFFVMKDAFNDVPLTVEHITKVTYYRLLIPTLLPQYDKCIYLDTDLVVNEDLADLYRTDVEDYYLAGVRAAAYIYSARRKEEIKERLNLPNVDNYINAGVLIMNLDRIRKHGLQETFIELSKRTLKSQDQDVLNLACYNNIKILPLRFNLMTKYVQRVEDKYCFNGYATPVHPESEQIDALAKPVIVHFADKKKPWEHPDCPLSEYWLKYIPHSTFCFEQLHFPIVQHSKAIELQSNKKCQSLEAENLKLKKTTASVNRQLTSVKKSVSFRIGQMITYIPRKIRGGIRCCKDHGIGYTAKRAFARIFRKKK